MRLKPQISTSFHVPYTSLFPDLGRTVMADRRALLFLSHVCIPHSTCARYPTEDVLVASYARAKCCYFIAAWRVCGHCFVNDHSITKNKVHKGAEVSTANYEAKTR